MPLSETAVQQRTTVRDRCVYIHLDKWGLFYIGMGAYDRPYSKSGRNEKWHERIKMNGGKYYALVLEADMTIDEASKYEKEAISFVGLSNLTNKSHGGQHSAFGMKHTDETKRKISENSSSRRPEFRERLKMTMSGVGNPMYGRIHSESARAKMSEARSDGRIYKFKYEHGEMNLTRSLFRAITGASVQQCYRVVKRGSTFKGWRMIDGV